MPRCRHSALGALGDAPGCWLWVQYIALFPKIGFSPVSCLRVVRSNYNLIKVDRCPRFYMCQDRYGLTKPEKYNSRSSENYVRCTITSTTTITVMALVGTLLFCTDCGDLLDREPPNLKKITCKVCQCINSSKFICLTL